MAPVREAKFARQTEEHDISIGEAGDVSLGDLHKAVAQDQFWKIGRIMLPLNNVAWGHYATNQILKFKSLRELIVR
jgi:hypothetical protein